MTKALDKTVRRSGVDVLHSIGGKVKHRAWVLADGVFHYGAKVPCAEAAALARRALEAQYWGLV